MALEHVPVWVRRSYAVAAFRKTENRIAALIVAAVAATVWVASQTPLSPGFAADLAAPDRRLALEQATFLGFGPPRPGGRRIKDAPARIVWNRPLPDRFDLVVEGRAPDTSPLHATLALDGSRRAVRFARDATRVRVSFENRNAGREITIDAAGLLVSRVAIEEPGR